MIASRSERIPVELALATDAAQGGLRQLRRPVVEVLDLDQRVFRMEHAEVDDGVHFYRHVVACDHVLGRHVHDDLAQAHLEQPIHEGDHELQAKCVLAIG